jgi:NAD-reducing hydrogenase large subunit
LGRLNAVDKITTPLAAEEFAAFKQIAGGQPVEGSLFYHYARLIELVFALEAIRDLLEDKDILSTDLRNYSTAPLTGRGIGVIEAPRGTLIHDYRTDENGLLQGVNLIVATGHNNWAMNRAVDTVAKTFVDGNTLTEGMLNRVEAAIRCYDPCLSCSTHAIGKMPLEIVLVTADGIILDRVVR